jgi:uncharacterized damage-inducible protein DinB
MLNKTIIPQLKHEGELTRKILSKVPYDQWDWKPHEKSMKLGRLASHVAEMAGWVKMTINSDELDFSKGHYKPAEVKSTEELLHLLDTNVQEGLAALENVSDETLRGDWTMRNGEHVIFTLPRIAVIRTVAISHLIHHRGQLSVYLRLLNVPVPGLYGPSADESFL